MLNWKTGAALVVSAVAVVGCTKNLEMDGVKTAIRDLVTKQIGATVKSVTCPEKREMKAGDTFDCQVAIDHGTTNVQVTQTDANGSISMKTTDIVLKIAELEKQVGASFKQNSGVDVAVDCGPRFRAVKPRDTFDCKATAPDTPPLNVKISVDEKGDVSFKSDPPPAAVAAATPEEEAAE
jgi:hypothetical protein